MLTKATTGAKFKYLRGKLLGLMDEDVSGSPELLVDYRTGLVLA